MPIRSKSHVRRLDRRRDAVESWFAGVGRTRWRRVAVWRLGGSCSAASLGASISERDDVLGDCHEHAIVSPPTLHCLDKSVSYLVLFASILK